MADPMTTHLTDAEREMLTCDCGVMEDDPTWPEMFCPFHADRMNLEVGGSADALVATVERIIADRLDAVEAELAVLREVVERQSGELAAQDRHAELGPGESCDVCTCLSIESLFQRVDKAEAEADAARDAVEEALTGALHPESGTEWREPDGVIWKAVQEARTEGEKRGHEAGWNAAVDEFKVNEPLRSDHPAIEQARAEGKAEADMWERQAQNFAVSATRETARADKAEKALAEADAVWAAKFEAVVYEYAVAMDGEYGCCHSSDDLRAGGRAPNFDGDEFEPLPDGCRGREVIREHLPADVATSPAACDTKARQDAHEEHKHEFNPKDVAESGDDAGW